jgi:hypothetical protein
VVELVVVDLRKLCEERRDGATGTTERPRSGAVNAVLAMVLPV